MPFFENTLQNQSVRKLQINISLMQRWYTCSAAVLTNFDMHLLWSLAPQDVTTGVSRLDRQAADRRRGEKKRGVVRKESQGVEVVERKKGKKKRETLKMIKKYQGDQQKSKDIIWFNSNSRVTSDAIDGSSMWVYAHAHTRTQLQAECDSNIVEGYKKKKNRSLSNEFSLRQN